MISGVLQCGADLSKLEVIDPEVAIRWLRHTVTRNDRPAGRYLTACWDAIGGATRYGKGLLEICWCMNATLAEFGVDGNLDYYEGIYNGLHRLRRSVPTDEQRKTIDAVRRWARHHLNLI